jgi:hypothetical protein
MARKKTPEERLAELEQKKRQIQEQEKRERAKLQSAERKKDTRRKIALGGAIIAHARADPKAARYLKKLIDGMAERDKAAFEGWEVPKPEQSTATASGEKQET